MTQSNSPNVASIHLAARATAAVAAVLVATVSVLLVIDYGRREWDDPFESPQFLAIKQQLANPSLDQGQRAKLTDDLRRLDQQLRREFFRRQSFALYGAHLLLVGAIVLVIADRTALALCRRLPRPEPAEPTPASQRRIAAARRARWAVVAVAGVLVVVLAIPGAPTRLPMSLDQLATPTAPPAPDYPTDEEIARHWPRFRGPSGAAISSYTNVPTTWDAASGRNILWKTPVPLRGNNSPIVWAGRVFLSGADRRRREVYCFDALTGKLLWTREAPSTPASRAKPPQVEAATGYAAPTMTTDGRRVFAIFANGDVVAVDFAGQVVWSRSLGIPTDNMYGYAASLAMWRDRLLIQWDEGAADDNRSKMIALSAATGQTVWQVPRPVGASWSSPIVVAHGGREQLITAADPWIIAYDPADGRELWRAEGITGDQGVTPVVADGLLQVGNEYGEWLALRIDGTGNVTDTHVVWRGEDGLPDLVSPLVTQGLLLLTTTSGVLTCYDAAKGEMLWDKDFDTEINSSPTAVGTRVYVFAKSGKGFVIEPSRAGCRPLAETDLAEPCVTSPAIQDGRLYIRTTKHLICIGVREP